MIVLGASFEASRSGHLSHEWVEVEGKMLADCWFLEVVLEPTVLDARPVFITIAVPKRDETVYS